MECWQGHNPCRDVTVALMRWSRIENLMQTLRLTEINYLLFVWPCVRWWNEMTCQFLGEFWKSALILDRRHVRRLAASYSIFRQQKTHEHAVEISDL